MTPLHALIQNPVAEAIGWTIFHSIWEGALVAAILALVLRSLVSARARYAAGGIALLAICGAFVVTFALVLPKALQMQSHGGVASSAALTLGASGDVLRAATFSRAALLLPWLAPFWLIGVILCQLRTFASWLSARRLRRRGICSAPHPWPEIFSRLCKQAGVAQSVALLESCFTQVPVVMGHLRPVVLVPLGMLTGMPAHQVEAILLHELAHIRRRDFLVNLLQSTVESFLFYHPAVWWISGIVRIERENCCDDIVIAMQGNRYAYATALAALEHTREAGNRAVLAATGGSLMHRIRRLLYPLESPRSFLTPIFSAAILTLTASLALLAWQTQPVPDYYKNWLVQDVPYIITDRERTAYQEVTTDPEREKFIEQFWERRNPVPGSVKNEFKDEHYRRIGFANSRFSSSLPGWKTDRGRMYIIYGPPDEIESHPSGNPPLRIPFEQWLYHHIEGVGDNVRVDFEDRDRNGEYHMTRDPDRP